MAKKYDNSVFAEVNKRNAPKKKKKKAPPKKASKKEEYPLLGVVYRDLKGFAARYAKEATRNRKKK